MDFSGNMQYYEELSIEYAVESTPENRTGNAKFFSYIASTFVHNTETGFASASSGSHSIQVLSG